MLIRDCAVTEHALQAVTRRCALESRAVLRDVLYRQRHVHDNRPRHCLV
jgi:hypothetical protein